MEFKEEIDAISLIESVIKPESVVEVEIMNDPEFIEGAMLGEPRRGHPEGKIIYHIEEVLANVDKCTAQAPESRKMLRFVALIHDTFKHKVDYTKPKVGENHHAMIARRFAEKYTKDLVILDIIELHDEAYNAYSMGVRKDNWKGAVERIDRLRKRLGYWLGVYMIFYWCDNNTGDKTQENYEWFEEQIKIANENES